MLVVTRTIAHCYDDSHDTGRSCYDGEGVEISTVADTDRQVSVAMVSVASRPLAYLLALTMARPQAACCHESQEQLRREKLLPLEVTAQLPTALPWENSAMNGIAEWKIH